MARTRIKICGIRDEESALTAADAGADAVGFMFVRTSPRFIDPQDAYGIMAGLPPMVSSVGVFANPTVDEFSDVEEACPTIYSQLHGDEDVQLVRSCGPDVIKAVRFSEATIARDLAHWDEVEEVCAILIDGTRPGEGVAFDWSLLTPHLEGVSKPIILAGGLNAENVGAAIREVRPYGVDVSSGVERERGIKDPALIEEFCLAVQAADRE
jgi:phosphoribosylanthranilate isomerase